MLPGVSGLYIISTRLWVLAGALLYDRGGEILRLSHVYFDGIEIESLKTLL